MKKFCNAIIECIIFILPLAVGAFLTWFWVTTAPAAPILPVEEIPQPVAVIPAAILDVVPQTDAYGIAQPATTFQIAAPAQGRIVHIEDRLKAGELIEKDSTILQIESSQYQLDLAKAKADIDRIKAQLGRIDQQVENDGLSLEIENASLQIAQRNLERARSLLAEDAASQADVDGAERTMLAQMRIVQSLNNSLKLAESDRLVKQAEISAAEIDLQKAQLNLDNTTVKSPVTAVLADIAVHEGQFINTDEPICEIYQAGTMKIECTIASERLRPLLNPETLESLGDAVFTSQLGPVVQALLEIDVCFDAADDEVHLGGTIGSIQKTDSGEVALTILVENTAAESDRSGTRLTKGTPCRIRLTAAPLGDRIVLPESAVENDHVYIIDKESRLRRQSVETEFTQADLAVLAGGLDPNDLVVVSGQTGKTPGTLVKPVRHAELIEKFDLLKKQQALAGVP